VYFDRKSLKDSLAWIVISAAIFALATVWYFVYAFRSRPIGPSGGSLPGLVFGAVATAIIVFLFLLTLRKTYRAKRWGKAYSWLQGHIWLGLITYPLVLYHAGGVRWGGTLTTALMLLFTIVYFSGVLGVLIQHFLPRWMLEHVPYETIYDQIDHVARENLKTARRLVRGRVGVVAGPVYDAELRLIPPSEVEAARIKAAADLKSFYETQVRPWLASDLRPSVPWKWLAKRQGWTATLRRNPSTRAQGAPPPPAAFAAMRQKLPKDMFAVVDELQRLCEERHQFNQQRRLHNVLHGWLLIHVPLSWAMMVLVPVHAVMALRYL
jgi:hypothetical protein